MRQRERSSIHTAVISSSSQPKVTDTYTVAVQHAQRAIAWVLTVGTKVLTGHDPTENMLMTAGLHQGISECYGFFLAKNIKWDEKVSKKL